MTEADKLLVVHRPSVKDCLWCDSMRNVFDLLNLSYKTAHILNAHDKSCDLSAYKSSIGLTFDFELGYVENANIYANTGQAIVFHEFEAGARVHIRNESADKLGNIGRRTVIWTYST